MKLQYFEALEGTTRDGLELTVKSILRGGLGHAFFPSPPEMRIEYDRVMKPEFEREAREWRERKNLAEIDKHCAPVNHSPESRENVRRMTEEYMARQAAFKAASEAARPKGPDPFAPDWVPNPIRPDDPRLAGIPDRNDAMKRIRA